MHRFARKPFVLLIGFALLTASALRIAAVQSPAGDDTSQAFDVASIKTNRSRTDSRGISVQRGRLAITGLTAREIVA